MSMVFKFRMLSDENDRFVRDYEALYDMSLIDFEEFIRDDLEYDPAMTSFFTADDRWNKLREFTLEDMGDMGEDAPVPMEGVVLGQLMHHNRDRLIYQFDMFGDRAYYLELIGAGEAKAGVEYPRVTLSEEPAPDQYDPTMSEAEGSAFDEMMGDFNDFEGDDNYDDEF
ncbi:MAG: hypothetical protein IKY65_00615 [Rikenellaceae bacterium]|nr:hypothetical protein [Rikenellaceae bacterium]